jgi:hypothetical protein
MENALAILTIVLLLVTIGCGFVIHYGGEAFKNAVKGHIVLGILTLIAGILLMISILK